MPENQYFIPTIGIETQDLDLPSGGKVQVRVMEVEDVIQMGLLDMMDILGNVVQTDHIARVKGTKKPSDRQPKKPTKAELAAREEAEGDAIMKLMADPAKFGEMSKAIDRVVATAVLQPKIQLAYNVTIAPDGKQLLSKHTPDQREVRAQGAWTDEIKFEDKMHIFAAVLPAGEAMKSFREGSGEAVGSLADEPEAASEAE